MSTHISNRRIWNIAYPIILGSIAQNIINVTDTAFLGRVSEVALGASAIGGLFYYVVVMLGFGFGTGGQIIIARRMGEKNERAVGTTTEHMIYFLIPLALIAFVLMEWNAFGLLKQLVKSPRILDASKQFISYRAWGLFFAYLNIAYRAFYVGIERTKVITWTTVVMAIVNISLDYCLIFGHFGFPEMGLEGAALASVIAEIAGLVFFTLYTLTKIDLNRFGLFRFMGFNKRLYGRIIGISFPVMMQNFISISGWFIFFLLVEHMGEQELAISNIIRSIYIVLMIPVWGFSAATNTLVSYVLGTGKTDQILPLIFRIILLNLSLILGIAILNLLFPMYVLRIYTNNADLIQNALPPLYVISGSALVIATGFTFFSGVSGTGKTRISFIIEVLTIGLYLFATWLLTSYWEVSIGGVWTAEYVYGFFLAFFSFLYLKYGQWRATDV